MSNPEKLHSPTAVVTGGSRGLGLGIVEALAAEGIRVVALARDRANLSAESLRLQTEYEVGDAADDKTAARLLQELRPDLVVLCAGASALLRPVHLHTWETFSEAWEVDTKSAFVWLRNALLIPMKPESHVVVVSSMAAVQGSPLSGGYAGAKRMQWLIAQYARDEALRLKLNLRIHCVLPVLNDNTDLGRAAVKAYADRMGIAPEEFAKSLSPSLTPAIMGQAIVDLHKNPGKWPDLAYRVTGTGLVAMA